MQSSNKALVQFSSHQEALAGLRSTEAVLGNRFIRILWANKDDELEAPNSMGSAALSSRPAPGPRALAPGSTAPAARAEAPSSSSRPPYSSAPTAPPTSGATPAATPPPAATASPAAIISAAKAQRTQEARSVLQQKDKLRKQLLEQQASLLEFMTKATSPAVKAQLKEQFDQVTKLLEAALEKDKSALDNNKKASATSTGTASGPVASSGSGSAPTGASAAPAATGAAAPKRAALTSSKEREKQLLDKELEILAESQSPADDRLKALQSELASLEKEVPYRLFWLLDTHVIHCLLTLGSCSPQASSYGIPTESPRSKFAPRGRGGAFAPRGGGRGRGSRVLDLRPTALELHGMPAELSNEGALRAHFGGSVSSIEFKGTSAAVVNFATRKAAEMVCNQSLRSSSSSSLL